MAGTPRFALASVLVMGALVVVGALGAGRLLDPCVGRGCHREPAAVAGGSARDAHLECLHAPCHAAGSGAAAVALLAAALPVRRRPVPAGGRVLRPTAGPDPSLVLGSGLFRPPRLAP